MLYKLIKLGLLGCLLAVGAHAQETFVVKFDSIYPISGESKCNSLRLLDMRKDRNDIGYIRTGMFAKPKRAITEEPLTTYLPGYFDKMPGDRKGQYELLLVLYNLQIEDQPNGNSIGTIYFDGDFYIGSNNQYRFLGRIDSLFELRAPFDVTTKLLKATGYKVGDLLSRFAVANAKEERTYTEAELLENREHEKQKYPIYRADSFKKGVYYTADQFINNQPTDTPFVKESYFIGEKKEMAYHYANKKGRKGKRIEENSFFAIYDGSTWAIGVGGHCEPITYKDGEFYAKKWLTGLRNTDGALLGAGILFGPAAVFAAEAALSSEKIKGRALYRVKFDPEVKSFVPVSRLQ